MTPDPTPPQTPNPQPSKPVSRAAAAAARAAAAETAGAMTAIAADAAAKAVGKAVAAAARKAVAAYAADAAAQAAQAVQAAALAHTGIGAISDRIVHAEKAFAFAFDSLRDAATLRNFAGIPGLSDEQKEKCAATIDARLKDVADAFRAARAALQGIRDLQDNMLKACSGALLDPFSRRDIDTANLDPSTTDEQFAKGLASCVQDNADSIARAFALADLMRSATRECKRRRARADKLAKRKGDDPEAQTSVALAAKEQRAADILDKRAQLCAARALKLRAEILSKLRRLTEVIDETFPDGSQRIAAAAAEHGELQDLAAITDSIDTLTERSYSHGKQKLSRNR